MLIIWTDRMTSIFSYNIILTWHDVQLSQQRVSAEVKWFHSAAAAGAVPDDYRTPISRQG